MAHQASSRREALASGAASYFTGKPCIRGHLAPRRTSGQCTVCSREQAREFYASRPNYQRNWQIENRERCSANMAAFRARDPDRARALNRAFKAANPKKGTHDRALARARAMNAVPLWADIAAIRQVYEACPQGLEVDHVIPLKHPLVAGLHVTENLQYLTRRENAQKTHDHSWEALQCH